MGRTSDDEYQIAHDSALLQWAKEAPQPTWDYDRGPTEEERHGHERMVKEHYERRPKSRNPYENERR